MWSGPHNAAHDSDTAKLNRGGGRHISPAPLLCLEPSSGGQISWEKKQKRKGRSATRNGATSSLHRSFIIFAVFQLIPLASTIYYSFFEYYRSGLKIIGPSFVGLKNYITLFATDLPKYFGNTHPPVDHRLYPADRRLAAAGSMVHRPAPEAEGPDLLQDGHLHAQPDHGFGLRHAVLRAVLGQRPGQRGADEHGHHLGAHQFPEHGLGQPDDSSA